MRNPREILARIREQADAATEGPWAPQPSADTPSGWFDAHVYSEQTCISVASDVSDADAEFIAASRTTVPALLDLADAVLGLADDLDRDGNAFMSDADPGRAKAAYALAARIRTTTTTALEGLHHA